MKFGLFYELSVPRPWTRESERTVYRNAAGLIAGLAGEVAASIVEEAETALDRLRG